MEEIFITNIHINKVRHLENIDIPLSDTERKHLILTGKNGSGKTSVLEALRDFLWAVVKGRRLLKEQFQFSLQTRASVRLSQREGKQKDFLTEYNRLIDLDGGSSILKNINLEVFGNEDEFLSDNKCVFAYFTARRNTSFELPSGIKKIEDDTNISYSSKKNLHFIQYLVNLQANKAFAQNDFEIQTVQNIDSWFVSFESRLKNLLHDESLSLHFDRVNYNYLIKIKNREACNFNELPDGYSSVIDIISELIMRMDSKSSAVYDLQGIVLIDEIETHLHIDLQKKILPFLTSFFPKIQFIVTTHSPFVLSSVDNAVIYDLEKQIRVEDLSGYSYSNIVKSYFGADEYSAELREKVSEYETLLNLNDLNLPQKERLYELKLFFKELPKSLSPELQLKISQLELAELAA